MGGELALTGDEKLMRLGAPIAMGAFLRDGARRNRSSLAAFSSRVEVRRAVFVENG